MINRRKIIGGILLSEFAEEQLSTDFKKLGEIIHSFIDCEDYTKVNDLCICFSSLKKIGYDKTMKHYIDRIMPKLRDNLNVLEEKYNQNPNHFETTNKLASLYQLIGQKYHAIDLYNKALKLSPSNIIHHEIIQILMDQFDLKYEQIPYIFENKLLELLDLGEINKAIKIIYESPTTNLAYRAELRFFEGDIYLQEFIIRLMINSFQNYPVDHKYQNYINGNIYFYYQYYNEALNFFESVEDKYKSPLVLRNLAYLYQSQQKFEEARLNFGYYLKLLEGENNES